VRYDSAASTRDARQLLLPDESHIESLLHLIATTGGPLRPVSAETPDQWPALVVASAAGRVDAISSWLSAHADLELDDPAVRVAIGVMLSELGLLASFLRVTTTGAAQRLDHVDTLLQQVRNTLDKGGDHAPDRSLGS
jgi:hypothetical protein